MAAFSEKDAKELRDLRRKALGVTTKKKPTGIRAEINKRYKKFVKSRCGRE